MQAVRCREGRVQLVDVPDPRGEGVTVRIRSAGICGSDLKMLEIGFPLACTLGQEMAGELSDGTPVAIEPIAPCGDCDGCRWDVNHNGGVDFQDLVGLLAEWG